MNQMICRTFIRIRTALAAGAFLFYIARGQVGLPAPAVVLSVLLLLYGVLVSFQKAPSIGKLGDMIPFFLILAVVVAVNLILLYLDPLRIALGKTLITGSLLDVVVSAAGLYLLLRDHVRAGLGQETNAQ